MTYNGFEYNEHGVCINPGIPENGYEVTQTIAELDRIISEESKPKIRQMTIFDYL